MKCIQNLIAATLIKNGFAQCSGIHISQDILQAKQFVVDVDIPVSSLLPFLGKYLASHCHEYSGSADDHPLAMFCRNAHLLSAGPVNLSSLRFSVPLTLTHLRLLIGNPELLHSGPNRDRLEYVFYRTSTTGKDLILALVEKGSDFINFILDRLQTCLMAVMPLARSLLDKVLENSVTRPLCEFMSERSGVTAKIVVEKVVPGIVDEILCTGWTVETLSQADKYLIHLKRYLSGRVMKRHIYAEIFQPECEVSTESTLVGKYSAPVIVTEYRLTSIKCDAIFQKAINHAVKTLQDVKCSRDLDALYM
ncbi:hypothetical protein I7V28_19525 [Lelliottia amnigena]|uniref:hypothetical protein n=1 Tax=Lelliottia TaxID=1330545 RepID=UPI00192C3A09|nr:MULTISPECIES: hypothetical protein [Lelliottia]MBL5885694.1 hypothetical protein [Lelliottia aquatilis]MBL5923273.1 hypothetical protein [Lelliottia amnigena]MBL5932182.1 hypothetical protein [Lelliottia amnigena]